MLFIKYFLHFRIFFIFFLIHSFFILFYQNIFIFIIVNKPIYIQLFFYFILMQLSIYFVEQLSIFYVCNRLKILLVLNLFLDEILRTVLFILNMIKFLGNILLRNLLLPKSNRQRTSVKTIGLELAIYLIRNLKTVLY